MACQRESIGQHGHSGRQPWKRGDSTGWVCAWAPWPLEDQPSGHGGGAENKREARERDLKRLSGRNTSLTPGNRGVKEAGSSKTPPGTPSTGQELGLEARPVPQRDYGCSRGSSVSRAHAEGQG